MVLVYQLIPGGYLILRDGRAWVQQPFNPDLPADAEGNGQPYPPAEAEAAAQAFIAEQLNG